MVLDALAPWAEPVLYTAADLQARIDDDRRYELVQGRLVRMPLSGFEHGVISSNFLVALRSFVDHHASGRVTAAETGFLLGRKGEADTVLAPDVAFLSAERVPAPGTHEWEGFARVSPDLVVEIASPAQHRPEMAAKARLWLGAGVRLVWVVWPATKTIEIWSSGVETPVATRGPADLLDGDDVLPGFSSPVASLFE